MTLRESLKTTGCWAHRAVNVRFHNANGSMYLRAEEGEVIRVENLDHVCEDCFNKLIEGARQ
jgi:hypothetical protein